MNLDNIRVRWGTSYWKQLGVESLHYTWGPDTLARDIADNLVDALEPFKNIYEDVGKK